MNEWEEFCNKGLCLDELLMTVVYDPKAMSINLQRQDLDQTSFNTALMEFNSIGAFDKHLRTENNGMEPASQKVGALTH